MHSKLQKTSPMIQRNLNTNTLSICHQVLLDKEAWEELACLQALVPGPLSFPIRKISPQVTLIQSRERLLFTAILVRLCHNSCCSSRREVQLTSCQDSHPNLAKCSSPKSHSRQILFCQVVEIAIRDSYDLGPSFTDLTSYAALYSKQ